MARSKSKPKTKTKQLDNDDDELQVKSKAKADDDLPETEIDDAEPAEVDDADAVDVDVDDPDAEPLHMKADADDEDAGDIDVDIDAGDADDGDADPSDDDQDSIDEGPTAPPAKITKTAICLILLNWIAAPAFLYVAFMDHSMRVQYGHRTLLNYLQIWGLPLEDEDKSTSLSMDTRPRLKLSAEQLDDAFSKRMKKSIKNFQPVDESVPLRVRPRDMTEALLTDVFEYQGVSDPVKTLDAEIRRLKDSLPGDIQKAAAEVLAAQNTDDEKRAVVFKTLLAIAWDVWQVKELEKTLTRTNGAALDTLVLESVQRRMYYDILAPLNAYRPGDISDAKKYKIEKMSDQTYSLEDVKGFLIERLDAALADEYKADTHIGPEFINEKQTVLDSQNKKDQLSSLTRGSVEKRQKIGFILFTLAHVSVPTLDTKLYPKGIERAQVVCGIYEFTSSSIRYVQALQILEERIVEAIKADRGGYALAGDKGSTDGFAREFELEIDRLVKLAENIDTAQKRLNDLRAQKGEFQKIFEQRTQQHKDALTKLQTARGETEDYAKKLRVLQEQLHTALLELSDAGERNFELEARIRTIELQYINAAKSKGGKR